MIGKDDTYICAAPNHNIPGLDKDNSAFTLPACANRHGFHSRPSLNFRKETSRVSLERTPSSRPALVGCHSFRVGTPVCR